MNSKNKNIFFKKFLIPYIIILIISIMFGLLVYNNNIKTYKNQANISNNILLNQTKNIIDTNILYLNKFANNLIDNPNYSKLKYINSIFYGSNVMRLYDLMLDIEPFDIRQDIVIDGFLVFKDKDLVINQNYIYKKKEFYENFVRMENISYSKWHDLLFTNQYNHYIPTCNLIYYDNVYSSFAYVTTVSNVSNNGNRFMFMLDNAKIQEIFKDFLQDSQASFYILDDNNNVISQFGLLTNEKINFYEIELSNYNDFYFTKVNNENMLLTYAKSDKTNLTFIIMQPKKTIYNNFKLLNITNIIVLIIYILAGIIIMILFSQKNSRPLNNILKYITENRKIEYDKDGFIVIDNALKDLMANNKYLYNQIELQKPLIINNLVLRLIHGNINIRKNSYRDIIDIDSFSGAVGVAYFHIYRENDVSLENIELCNTLIKTTFADKKIHTILEGNDRLILLMFFQKINTKICYAMWEESLNNIYQTISSKLNIKLIIGISDLAKDLTDVSQSYNLAYNTVNQGVWYNLEGIISYNDFTQDESFIEVNNNISRMLTDLVIESKQHDIDEVFDSIYKHNIIENKLDANYAFLYVVNLYNELKQISRRLGLYNSKNHEYYLDKLIYEFKNLGDVKVSFDLLRNYCQNLINKYHERSIINKSTLIDNLNQYLYSHYTNANLSLSLLSEKFSLSASYISQYYKEKTNQNISLAIEHYRVEHAKKLLTETSLSASKIATQSGFYSITTFGRAFKKSTGLTPTEYRKLKC